MSWTKLQRRKGKILAGEASFSFGEEGMIKLSRSKIKPPTVAPSSHNGVKPVCWRPNFRKQFLYAVLATFAVSNMLA